MNKTLKLKGDYKRIMVISDLHFPVEHPEALDFLEAMKDKYRPDLCVQIGDLVDLHNFSRYKKDPNFISPVDEIERGKAKLRELQILFPKLYIVWGNHDVRIKDRAKEAGIPDIALKDFVDLYDIFRPNWHFCYSLTLNDRDERRRVLFIHGKKSDPVKLALEEGYNIVQGHYHTKPLVDWAANSKRLIWGMNVGCLVNNNHICFDYAALNTRKFILGSGIIENGTPKFIPMYLDDKSRWYGKSSL